jgi:hypothetical protein
VKYASYIAASYVFGGRAVVVVTGSKRLTWVSAPHFVDNFHNGANDLALEGVTTRCQKRL